MRKLSHLVTAAVVAGALALPAAAAHAAPQVGGSDVAVSAKPKKKALKLSANKPGSHFGQPGVEIKAKSSKKKGKITFSVAGQAVTATKKLKKGKASFQLPPLPAGSYKVKAKIKGGGKATIKTQVYNSSLSLSTPAVTLSISAPCSTSDPVLTGTVLFKGANPSTGYVDAYLNGNIKGGSQSPDYLTFDSVEGAGAFDFGTCDTLWSDVKALGVGTHRVQLLYTPDASFEDYIYSDFITITVVA